MQVIKSFTVDLTKVRGRGDFKCPKCGIKMSPDDKTENVYTILEPVVKEGYLQKVILQCNSCGSQIHLTGFSLLNKIR
jgi:transcription elongation factor Elf1